MIGSGMANPNQNHGHLRKLCKKFRLAGKEMAAEANDGYAAP
jgi:hypothetical protein